MNYRAMTVNERLWVSGEFYDFENAIKCGNSTKLVEILKRVHVDDKPIEAILEKYGLGIFSEELNKSD